MESGQHRISFKLMKGSASELFHLFGVVRDGRAWNTAYPESESTDAWYMHSGGGNLAKPPHNHNGNLFGNGKSNNLCNAGSIKEGQIISMEADLDKGTLHFWLDGQPHGPGWSSGVKGKLRWNVSLYYEGPAVQIVPTPELQPWAP